MARLADRTHRTQITLTDEQYTRVSRLAARRGVSIAAVIRVAIELYATEPDRSTDDLFSIVGMCDSGNPNASEQHDAVVYRR
jgi:hypothetical protein